MSRDGSGGAWAVAALAAALSHLALAAMPLGGLTPRAEPEPEKPVVRLAALGAPAPPAPALSGFEPPGLREAHSGIEAPLEATPPEAPPPSPPPPPPERSSPPVETRSPTLAQAKPALREAEPEPAEIEPSEAPAAAESDDPAPAAEAHEAHHEPTHANPDEAPREVGHGSRAPAVAAAESSAEHLDTSAGSLETDMRNYGRRLARAIEAEQRYPMAARRMGLEGVALVNLRVNEHGLLEREPMLSRSSGTPLLDREALRMVRAAAPFPPPPPGLDGKIVDLPVPIRFELR